MKFFYYALLTLFLFSPGFAQNINVNLIAHIDNYPNIGYSDCWGYTAPDGREYALLGVNAGVSIVDVTNPNQVFEVEFVPFVNFGWYDMKTYRNYMYVTSEGTTDLLIVDLAPLPDSATVVGRFPLFSTTPHNNFIDTTMAVLYGVEDFNFNPSVRILSIISPENPTELSRINPANNGADAHDIFAQDSVLYIAEGSSGTMGIFDVGDPASPSLITRLNLPSPGYVHQVWVSEDNHYMVTTEETVDKTVKLWDIQNLNNITLIGEYLGESRLAHNAFLKEDYVILSHYESGLKIVDISNPAEMVEVGSFDTYPQGDTPNFNGAWGVYPFTRNGMIFISDIQSGLYVVQFDSVRAGGIEGTVTDAQTGTAVADVDIFFVEANKTAQTDQNGLYSFRTFEGNHTIIYSKLGYFPDTLSLTLPSGPNIIQNVALEPNLADIDVSPDSLSMTLPVNTTATSELVISNVGPGGRLDYIIDDINGPVLSIEQKIEPIKADWNKFDFTINLSTTAAIEQINRIPKLNGTTGDTIIIDPAGDPVFGSGGDIIGLYATQTGSEIIFEFEFLNPIDTDSTFILFSLDTDFNSNTGAFPGGFGFNLPAQNIGSEFDILVDIPGFFSSPPQPFTFYIWPGANSPPNGPPLFFGGVTLNANNIISLVVPLAAIGDDGNLAVAGFGGHFDPTTGPTSIDYVPDVGHGEIGINPLGDLPWLSLSLTDGSLLAGESDTVTVTFDTNGLEQSEVFTGVLMITSNDPDETVVAIPVTLFTEPVLGIDSKPAIPKIFILGQNYPNPFNPTTNIKFQIPDFEFVDLVIYDLLGREVTRVISEELTPASYEVQWDGKDKYGKEVSSGIYIYRLKAGNSVKSRKMVLVH